MTPEEVKGPIDKQNPTVYEFYEWSDVTLVDTLPVKKTPEVIKYKNKMKRGAV